MNPQVIAFLVQTAIKLAPDVIDLFKGEGDEEKIVESFRALVTETDFDERFDDFITKGDQLVAQAIENATPTE